MAHHIANLNLVTLMPDAEPRTADQHYPRHLVVSGVLAFSLAIWTIVILAVAHYA